MPQCRREAKELVVEANGIVAVKKERPPVSMNIPAGRMFYDRLDASLQVDAAAAGRKEISQSGIATRIGAGEKFIGGGCCVHLSVEYMPLSPLEVSAQENVPTFQTAASVLVLVGDSEGTGMGWMQTTGANSVYQVRENILTTKPGARLAVLVENMVARVRWCEVFSC
jgi:hypothetical protein